MICMETALPAKFAESIREAIGEEPRRRRLIAASSRWCSATR